MGSYPRFCTCPSGQVAVICLIPMWGWRLLTCRVLPDLIVAAATRPRTLDRASIPAHSPCSQSHARLAGRVTTTAGGLLPHRFAPYRHTMGVAAGILSVAVVVRTRLSPACPRLLFRGATLSRSQNGSAVCPGCRTGSREVPLGSSHPLADSLPSDGSPIDPPRLYHETRTASNSGDQRDMTGAARGTGNWHWLCPGV